MTSPSEMFEVLRHEPDADEMDFMVRRPPEKRRAGQTISKEALDEFTTAIDTFILARLQYHWEAREGGFKAEGPAVIRAEVRIHIDDVHRVPSDESRPWFALRSFGLTD